MHHGGFAPRRLSCFSARLVLGSLLALLAYAVLAVHFGISGIAANVAAASPNGWQVVTSEATTDTLDAPWQEVMPAARKELEEDDWRIDLSESRPGRWTTQWAPLRRSIFRHIMGDVRVRCEVLVKPLDANRSVVSLRSRLASPGNPRENPAFPLAMTAYQVAVKGYFRDLRQNLARQRDAAPVQVGSGVEAGTYSTDR